MSVWKLFLALPISTLAFFVNAPLVSAQTSSSSNYEVTETFFGTGGELDASSATYRSKQSAGELTVGALRSATYSAQAGFNTDRMPFIAMATLTSNVDVGVLDISHANVGTAQFWVSTYLADGYVVRSYGGPPSNGSHQLNTSATNFTSAPGTEQFGINLAVNNVAGSMTGTPLVPMANFGATPTQAPDYPIDPFGFGEADADYATANNFRYINGDIVGLSARSSSDTTYTISYLFNISEVTPAGTYDMAHVLVATATY